MRHFATLAFLFMAVPAFAQDDRFGVRIREWLADLDGETRSDEGALSGTSISLDSDLGFDDEELAHEIALFVDVPILGRFNAGYWWVDFDADETLNRTITFEGETYAASSTVKSELELDVFYASYEPFSIGKSLGEAASVEFALQIGARLFMIEASIENEFTSSSEDGNAPIPVVGARVAVRATPWLEAAAEAAGIAVKVSDVSASYIEGLIEVVALPWKGFFGGVGYKFISVDIEDESSDRDEFELDLDIDGFYFTAGVRF